LTDHERSAVVCLLKELLLSIEKLARDGRISDDHLLDLVAECDRSVGQLRTMMGSSQEPDTGDGTPSGRRYASLRSDESVMELIRQVDVSLRHCIGELSARRQCVAGELHSLRCTQRATKAYQGIEPA
jgi:hypothetical protein